jgi:hypothetical protein
MDRRDVVTGGLAGLTALIGGPGETVAGQPEERREMARAVDRLRELLERRLEPPFRELSEIRRQQRVFLKASHTFPEFIEIGAGVWDALFDWSVRYQQSLNVRRGDDGHYTMTFMFTTLVLRPDQADDYVSLAYDAR